MIVKGFNIPEEESTTAKKRLLLVTIFIAGLFIMLKIFPVESFHYYPPCIFYKVTDLYCPGCGTLRGINETFEGNLMGMWEHNKLGFIILPLLIYSFANLLSRALYKYNLPVIQTNKYIVVTLVLVVFLYGILRNIFTFLAP